MSALSFRPSGRRRLAGGLIAAAAFLAAGVVAPTTATAAGLDHTAVTARSGSAPSTPTLHTSAPQVPVDDVVGIVNGVRRPGSVKPLADIRAETLQVSLDKSSVESYWYWADGVTLTVRGATPGSTLVIKDFGPRGELVTTFDPVTADGDGSASVKLKGDLVGTGFPTPGVHRLTVNSSFGQLGSTLLTVTPQRAGLIKVSLSTSKLTQQQWYRQPITVTATGFAPNSALFFNIFDPVQGGAAVGQALRADAKGVFRYTIQAGTAFASVGLWEIGFTSYDPRNSEGYSGRTVFTVLPSPMATVGTVTTSPSRLTQARMSASGVRYSVAGMRPWAVLNVSVRSALGTDADLGDFRVNGEGTLTDTITVSGGELGSGRYVITVRELSTGNHAAGVFTVTNADGSVALSPAVILQSRTMTRLQTMDPARGIVVTATGFTPDAVVYLEITDALNARMRFSSASVAVAPADARGRVTFTVNPRLVPTVGPYTVTATSYLSPVTIARGALSITP